MESGGYELNFEYGYRLYNKFITILCDNSQAITVSNSLLILLLFSKLIKSQSPYVFLSVWLYVTLGIYQTQMNMARNAIGIFISYIGCTFIEKKDMKRFLFFIFLATLFHTSSILFLPLYWLVTNIELSSKRIVKLFVFSICFGLFFPLIRPYIITYLPFGFGRYFISNTSKLESLLIGVFHLTLFICVLFFMDEEKRKKAIKSESLGVWMLVLEIMFFCIGFDVAAATRMSALYGPFLIIMIPKIIENGFESKNKKLDLITLIIIITGFQYILRLGINNIGSTIPYVFFWDNVF